MNLSDQLHNITVSSNCFFYSRCFLLLLLLAAVLWKIKQKYDMFRRRQRLFVEMEQMASRPFSEVIYHYGTVIFKYVYNHDNSKGQLKSKNSL